MYNKIKSKTSHSSSSFNDTLNKHINWTSSKKKNQSKRSLLREKNKKAYDISQILLALQFELKNATNAKFFSKKVCSSLETISFEIEQTLPFLSNDPFISNSKCLDRFFFSKKDNNSKFPYSNNFIAKTKVPIEKIISPKVIKKRLFPSPYIPFIYIHDAFEPHREQKTIKNKKDLLHLAKNPFAKLLPFDIVKYDLNSEDEFLEKKNTVELIESDNDSIGEHDNIRSSQYIIDDFCVEDDIYMNCFNQYNLRSLLDKKSSEIIVLNFKRENSNNNRQIVEDIEKKLEIRKFGDCVFPLQVNDIEEEKENKGDGCIKGSEEGLNVLAVYDCNTILKGGNEKMKTKRKNLPDKEYIVEVVIRQNEELEEEGECRINKSFKSKKGVLKESNVNEHFIMRKREKNKRKRKK